MIENVPLIINICVLTTICLIYLVILISRFVKKHFSLTLIGISWVLSYIGLLVSQLFEETIFLVLTLWCIYQFFWFLLVSKVFYNQKSLVFRSSQIFLFSSALGLIISLIIDDLDNLDIISLIVLVAFLTLPSLVGYVFLISKMLKSKNYIHKVLSFSGFNLFSNITIFFYFTTIIYNIPVLTIIFTISYVATGCALVYYLFSIFIIGR